MISELLSGHVFRPGAPLALFDNFSGGDWVAVTLAAVILIIAAFIVGRQWARLLGHRERKERNEKMFQIEKSLSDFYEHEKKKFLADHEELTAELERKDQEIIELRRKAAGVSGRGKDARADLMLQLLTENEALQEKLFEENVRQKEERDRQLSRELQQISYQRVLLSRLLSERGVQEAVVEILGDDRRVAELRAATPKLEELPSAGDAECERAREERGDELVTEMLHGSRFLARDGFYHAENAVLVGDLTIGEQTNIWYGTVLRGDDAPITIGARVNLQDLTMVHADPDKPLVIEDDVTVGHRAIVHCLRVGARSLIGMGAILMEDVVIGEESLVAAGTVVPPGVEIPPRSLVRGVPGRVARETTEAERENILWSTDKYVKNAIEFHRRYGGE